MALKLLPYECTADAVRVRRFEREAKAASALNHPNILTIHEIGREGDCHFIATEFIEGQTLRRRMAKGKMDLQEALEVAIQVATALAAAHAVGIVHRDIKPENIMLRPDGYIKVLDFGLAKLIEMTTPGSADRTLTQATTETAPGAVMGTLSYMSPEQVSGQPVDARADVWGLAVVFYEMVAGEKPFRGSQASDIMVSILDRDPPPLSLYLKRLQPVVDSVVTKALAKNRDERYQAAQEFAQELKKLRRRLEIEGDAIAPAPRRTIFRTPVAAAVLALIALAAAGVGFWLMLQSAPPSAPVSAVVRERRLSYSLTVQKMREGKPYQEPFELSSWRGATASAPGQSHVKRAP